jgi:hypothetical protein
MRRVGITVPMAECKMRALRYMSARDRREYVRASQVAQSIWPDAHFLTGQGAGAAASRILKALEREGKVRWGVLWDGDSNAKNWGYQLTAEGRSFTHPHPPHPPVPSVPPARRPSVPKP